MSRPETCPGWTFTTAYEYLQSLPRDAWRKGYRVRVLNALSRIVQAPDTPDKWDDVWFTCFKNCGDGSLAEAKRLLAQHDPAPPPAAVSATGREVVVYRPASWKGQAPDDAKGRDEVRWGALPRADYDALVARVEKLRDEGFAMYAAYHAALKQRDEARALLREARGCVAVNYGPNEFSRLLARIDRCLEDKA